MSGLWQDFLASWPLFWESYLTGLCAATLLALIGVFAIARRQLFLGVVVAQCSTLGIALVLGLAALGIGATAHDVLDAPVAHGHLHGPPLIAGIAFALVAAFLTGSGRRPAEATEALGLWLFVVASSASVLLLAHGPHGLEEIQRLTFSSLIGADAFDVVKLGVLLAAAIALLLPLHRSLLLVATEPEFATALGLRTGLLRSAISAAQGIAIGATIHSTGTLFCVANLTLPGLCARRLARTMRGTLLLAPAIAVAANLLAFVLANGFDYPPGQVAAALLAALTLLAHAVPRR